jgi:hypothetical protein
LLTAKLTTNSSSAFGAALALAQHGLAVFPVFGKRPLTEHGVYSASRDPKIFCGFDWGRHSDCAVATGEVSGICVLDVDMRERGKSHPLGVQKSSSMHGVGVNGFATLSALGALPETLCASTPNAGRHYYFKHVPGSRNCTIGAGLEWFSTGKLVVVPPASGRAWLNDCAIADAPVWLRELVLAAQCAKGNGSRGDGEDSSGPQVAGSGAGTEVPKLIYGLILRLMRGADARSQRRARALYNLVAGKIQGRNDALNFAAYCFRELPIPREGAAELLMRASKANGYLAKDGEEAVRATIMSGLGLKDWPDAC